MDIHLFKVSKVCWAVKSMYEVETRIFKTIEEASEYLESIHVLDEHIDAALIDMLAGSTSHAVFSSTGTFVVSDNEKLDELLGVA